MALAEAILVCLTEGPQTGYDLAKTFESSIGFFWRADHQQIYRELKKIGEQGWSESDQIMQTDRPNKRVHRITPKGLEHLHHWSSESAKPPAVKDDMMVRFYALDHIDLEAIRWQIKERKRQHEERLHTYQFIMAKRFDQLDALDKKQIGKRLGLKLGIRYESNWIEWCDEALSELSGLK